MAEVIRIVLTGGPCGGKTKALRYVSEKLEELKIRCIVVENSQIKLALKGKTPATTERYDYYKQLFEEQLAQESKAFKLACSINADRVVVLSDGGLLDSRAYVTQSEFERYAGLNGTNEDIIRNSYDAVFHLVTAANGAEDYYFLSSNPSTSMSVEAARGLDEEIIAAWTGTPHLRVFDNSSNFRFKVKRLMEEITAFIGVPEPFEIERKFLIEHPDLEMLNNIKTCRRIPITQAYFNTPDEGRFRIRKRGEGDKAVYIKTAKKKISDIKRVEIEHYISEKEYNDYLSQKEYIIGKISKDRYCIVWNYSYYELDIYPFWADKATLEIELCSENQSYAIPSFVKLIREVSFEPEYRNLALAQKYKSLD